MFNLDNAEALQGSLSTQEQEDFKVLYADSTLHRVLLLETYNKFSEDLQSNTVSQKRNHGMRKQKGQKMIYLLDTIGKTYGITVDTTTDTPTIPDDYTAALVKIEQLENKVIQHLQDIYSNTDDENLQMLYPMLQAGYIQALDNTSQKIIHAGALPTQATRDVLNINNDTLIANNIKNDTMKNRLLKSKREGKRKKKKY